MTDGADKVITGAIAALLTFGLGIWAKISFVRRSELYQKDGKPIYQHADGCKDMQASCNKVICSKIDELKQAHADGERKRDHARTEMYRELNKINSTLGRFDQFMIDHKDNQRPI